MSHGGQTPYPQFGGIADAKPDPVDDISRQKKPNRICCLKSRHNVAVLVFVPPYLFLKERGQYRKHLPVQVVDSGCKEQQCADSPSVPANAGCHASGGGRVSYLFRGTNPRGLCSLMAQYIAFSLPDPKYLDGRRPGSGVCRDPTGNYSRTNQYYRKGRNVTASAVATPNTRPDNRRLVT